jgi:prepilin-type N-terminal cleavage/methylation domain-containing protein
MRRRKAFTLVELLVVIAIIAILIAILLPVCITIRRRALALVCPIAYRGQDGGVYLTDPKGGHSLQISESGWVCSLNYTQCAPISWSPGGLRVAYNAYQPFGATAAIIHEPTTGKTWRIDGVPFNGWIDDDTVVCSGLVYKLEGRTVVRSLSPMMPGNFDALCPTPLGADRRLRGAYQECAERHLGRLGGKELSGREDNHENTLRICQSRTAALLSHSGPSR